MKGILGGAVRLMITASAPLSEEVKLYFRKAINCPFLEAYG